VAHTSDATLPSSAPALSDVRWQTWLEAVGVVALVAAGLVLLFTKNSSFFNFWTDRDMVRSANLLNEFQYMAAELSYGAASRVPGGALHYLWFLPTMVSSDPNLSYKFCVLLCLLAAVPFYLAMRRYFGISAAVVSTAVLFASPVTFSTMMRLWNPSFQVPFLILAAAFMIHLVAGKNPRAFKWMVASLVIAMQMHVSTWLLMIALVPALILTRTRIPWTEALWALLLFVVLLAPYLIGEFQTGWDNVRTMLASQGKGAVRKFEIAKGLLFNFDNTRDIWAWFAMSFGMTDNLPAPPLSTPLSWLHNSAFILAGIYVVLSLAHWLEWGRPIGRWLGQDLGGASGRVVVAAVAPVLLAYVYTAYSPQLELVVYGNSRYVMFAVPGLAILAGLGAAALIRMAGSSQVAGGVAVAAVAVTTALPLWSLATSVQALDLKGTPPGRQFMGSFNIVQKDRNWSTEDTIARMSVLRSHDSSSDRWKFESIFAIGYELYRDGKEQPFARGGECVAYLTGGNDVYGDKGITVEALERSFQQPGLQLRLISQRAVGRDRLVVYERVGKPCFTTLTNRYVFSSEEREMFSVYGSVAEGRAVPAKPKSDETAGGFIMNLGQGIYAQLKTVYRDGKLNVELHSNQLRGDTYNGGFLDAGMISNARLVLTNPVRDPVTIMIDEGLIGGKGTFTPIRIASDVPPGVYDIEFMADVYPPVPLGTWPVDFNAKKPVSIKVMIKQRIGG
jgi:hypothetical protein